MSDADVAGPQQAVTDDRHWRALLAGRATSDARLLFSLAYNLLRDRAAADDACQRALLAAWEHRATIADPSRVGSWLATAVVNHSVAALRRRQVERRAAARLAEGARHAADGGGVPAEARACAGELREAVALALGGLPPPERMAVALRVMQGMSGREAAALLGVSEGQVSKLLHRGMEALRRPLAAWDAEAP